MTDVSHDVASKALVAWVERWSRLCKPDRVHWCDGSQEEYDALCDEMVAQRHVHPAQPGEAPELLPRALRPSDVARVEDRTFICSRPQGRRRPDQQLGGPRGDEGDADAAVRRLHARAARCTSSRSAWARSARRSSHIGVELTDSPYVVVNMRIMTRMGSAVLDALGRRRLRAVPALGRHAARAGTDGRALAVQPRQTSTSSTSPKSARSGRYGSGYGGNALLGKKCFALRIASVHGARRRLAGRAHADPRRRDRPTGEKTYVAAAFPSACGKTNFAMLIPPEGVRAAGRSRPSATTSPGSSRRRTASSTRSIPKRASSASRPARSTKTNPNAMATIAQEHDLHQRRADRRRRCVVGRHDRRRRPRTLIDWQGKDWTPDCGQQGGASQRALHRAGVASARRSTRLGRPAGRADLGLHLRRPPQRRRCRSSTRRSTGPTASTSAATMGSETTAAAAGNVGAGAPRPVRDAAVLRLPHGRLLQPLAADRPQACPNPPRIFSVNWFRKRRGRQVPLARLRREHARAEVDRRARRTAAPSASKARSAGCRATRTSTGTGLRASPRRSSTS